MAEQAIVAQLAFTLARRWRHAAAGHVGVGSGGGRRPVSIAQDGQRPGGLGADIGGHVEVPAAALCCPQTCLQSALPALQSLHQLLQLRLGAGAPQGGPSSH